MTNSLLLNMAIEIVDFPMKHGDFPVRYVKLPEGIIFQILHQGIGLRENLKSETNQIFAWKP